MPILGTFMPNMGIHALTLPPKTSRADALFLGTKERLLGLLFG
jgi:hypothetical protein